MTATLFNAGKNRVEFLSVGTRIVGNLYCPDNFDSGKTYPAVVVGGPLATVKEQAAGVFAEKLSKQGFLVLAFDYRTFGESDGELRCYENPSDKTEDIQNAVSFLATLENVDSSKIAALGICASASYVTGALIGDKRIQAFATVSGYFNLQEFVTFNPMVTEETRAYLFKLSNDARQKYFETGVSDRSDVLYAPFDGTAEVQFMKDVYDYYFTRVESCWPNFSRELTLFSIEQLAKSNALDYAKYITTPYLGIVGENAPTRTQTEQFLEVKSQGVAEFKELKGACHIQAYDLDKYVDQAVGSIAEFFNNQLNVKTI
ncbi:alpha/beta hydrolase [Shewanella atlantica]|uniref:Alpha/beta hydrolase n=1 Tax=Shewanella atlantica TaxID=271099 RepID=A0A3S0IV43_9GAMM|nr:alpha/beta hydrolase [Shewanella atlantica]RTR32141.1 alpha/beta hydrolase [Shewanella atlantica]